MSSVAGLLIRIYEDQQIHSESGPLNQPEFGTIHSAFNKLRFDSILFNIASHLAILIHQSPQIKLLYFMVSVKWLYCPQVSRQNIKEASQRKLSWQTFL